MDIYKIIQYTIVGVLTLTLSTILTSKLNSARPKEIAGDTYMEMPKLYLVLSNLLFLFFVFTEFLVWYFKSEEFVIIEKLIYGAFGLFLGFGGFNTLLLFLKHKVIYDDTKITQTNWLGKTTCIDWIEIKKISFSPIASSLKIETQGQKIMIHEHIKGYKIFIDMVSKKTNLKLK